jgi:negative regulator of sigma E activity
MRLPALPRLAVVVLAFAALNGQTINSDALADDFPDRPITLMVPLAQAAEWTSSPAPSDKSCRSASASRC